jgi:hypothetical protein
MMAQQDEKAGMRAERISDPEKADRLPYFVPV